MIERSAAQARKPCNCRCLMDRAWVMISVPLALSLQGKQQSIELLNSSSVIFWIPDLMPEVDRGAGVLTVKSMRWFGFSISLGYILRPTVRQKWQPEFLQTGRTCELFLAKGSSIGQRKNDRSRTHSYECHIWTWTGLVLPLDIPIKCAYPSPSFLFQIPER